MRILAIDSSGLVASVAVVERREDCETKVLAEYTTNFKKTHSQTLLPMIDEITTLMELNLATIDAIAIAKGPGSFTGLRIGSATAKGLGYALKKPIVEIPTVDGLAYQLYGVDGVICPMMDARRGQVYTGIYTFRNNQFRTIVAQKATSVEDIVKELNAMKQPVYLLGDGVDVNIAQIRQQATVPVFVVPAFASRQRAAALGCLAVQEYEAGHVVEAAEHAPDYLRLSQAERERLERATEQAHE